MASKVLNYDIEIDQGSDYGEAFPILDDNNQPVTVAGWSARCQFRKTPTSPIPRLSFDTNQLQVEGFGLEISGDEVILRIPGSASALWAWTEGHYAIELVDPLGAPRRIVAGRVFVSTETTR
jgi:hypothetical protein